MTASTGGKFSESRSSYNQVDSLSKFDLPSVSSPTLSSSLPHPPLSSSFSTTSSPLSSSLPSPSYSPVVSGLSASSSPPPPLCLLSDSVRCIIRDQLNTGYHSHAFKSLEQLSEQHGREDSGDAAALLSLLYHFGIGTKTDVQNRDYYLKMSVTKGSQFGKMQVAFRQNDRATFLPYFQQLANEEVSVARYILGTFYQNSGMNGPSECLPYFEAAAQQGLCIAQYSLGLYHEKVSGNLQAARHFYKMAANQSYKEAMFCFGNLLYFGRGGEPDHSAAAQWFYYAANQSHVQAAYQYGMCCKNGVGVARNIDEAVKYLKWAADQGSQAASLELSKVFYFLPFLLFISSLDICNTDSLFIVKLWSSKIVLTFNNG